jgi:beta-glucosidase
MDLPNLSLPDNQDFLIEQVAAAYPRTIVVLETGTAVTMPWIDKVAGVVEAWYAGSAGHKAVANVLAGVVNPSGRLPITFPKSENDLPRPVIAAPSAQDRVRATGAVNAGTHASSYAVHYDEGSKVGYKWYEAENKKPLFAFGFGLSYTSYAYSNLKIDSAAKTASFTIKNTGRRAGTETGEVYVKLPKSADEPFKRLAGWTRVALGPGESKTVTVALDPRVLQTFDESKNDWTLVPGEYGVLVGGSSDSTPLTGTLGLHR